MSAFSGSREEEEEEEDEDEDDDEDDEVDEVDSAARTQKKKMDSLMQAADLLNRAFESVAQERSSGGMITLLGNNNNKKGTQTPVRVSRAAFNFQLLMLCWLVAMSLEVLS